MRVLLVELDDTTSMRGWADKKKAEKEKPTTMKVVGFFINEDANYVRIAGMDDQEGDINHLHILPKKAIKRKRFLK